MPVGLSIELPTISVENPVSELVAGGVLPDLTGEFRKQALY